MKNIITILLLISLLISACGSKELNKEIAKKLITEYYHLPFQTKIVIDKRYEDYGWPPEKYHQLQNQGFITIKQICHQCWGWKIFETNPTNNARKYWLQNGTMQSIDKRINLLIFKGYIVDLKEVSISSNAKENKAEGEIILKFFDSSPIQQVFSPLEKAEIKKVLNFKLFDDGWKIVEDENSKHFFQAIVAPQHWAESSTITFGDTILITLEDEEGDAGFDPDNPVTTSPSTDNSVASTITNNGNSFPGLYPQASQRILTNADFIGKNNSELKIMRNEIFARHGYIFKTPEMKSYFAAQPWYRGQHDDVTSMLSNIEKQNVELIKKHE